jgi:hypothetical protein
MKKEIKLRVLRALHGGYCFFGSAVSRWSLFKQINPCYSAKIFCCQQDNFNFLGDFLLSEQIGFAPEFIDLII